MNSCMNCKYAAWKRTQAGKLHPSGDGKCKYPFKIPQLPASMYWMGRSEPKPHGGFISRKTGIKALCAYFCTEEVEG